MLNATFFFFSFFDIVLLQMDGSMAKKIKQIREWQWRRGAPVQCWESAKDGKTGLRRSACRGCIQHKSPPAVLRSSTGAALEPLQPSSPRCADGTPGTWILSTPRMNGGVRPQLPPEKSPNSAAKHPRRRKRSSLFLLAQTPQWGSNWGMIDHDQPCREQPVESNTSFVRHDPARVQVKSGDSSQDM
ncbi:hypothetical protein QBC45DRAFT_401494 [Copromyces sp. CBS 386.78]|nr:hypothetical protein QBC45DRAFT_401494 [Copromyces sp. CBS 386.78]